MNFIFILMCIVYGLCAIYFATKNDYTTICFFLTTILFQNIIVILFSDTASSMWITIFSLIKEGMLYLSIVLYVIKGKKTEVKRNDAILAFSIVAIFAKNLFVTGASISAAIISLRQCLIPFLGVSVGQNLRIEKKGLSQLLKFIVYCSLFLSVFGLIELVLLGDDFWVKLGYAKYMYTKQGTLPSQLFKGVTRNFYTWDFGSIPLRRIVSITADPLATAHLMFIGFAIIFSGSINSFMNKSATKNPNQYFAYMIFLFLCSALSLSKAIFVFMAITFVVIAYYKKLFPPKVIKYGSIVSGMLILLYIIQGTQNAAAATATSNHISGLINGFKNSSILGTGLGTAGVMTAKIANSSISTTESYVGTYVQQIGYIGFAITLFYFRNIYTQLLAKWKTYKSKYVILAMALYIGIIFEMFFSESSVSIMGTCIYFIFIGVATRDKIYR